MAVTDYEVFPNEGVLVGELTWAAAPGVVFELTLDKDGAVRGFGATKNHGDGITATLMRRAPIRTMERALREHVETVAWQLRREPGTVYVFHVDPAEHAVEHDALASKQQTAAKRTWNRNMSRALDDFGVRPRPGSAGRDDEAYAYVAALYVSAFTNGSRAPVMDVAAQIGRSRRQVVGYLEQARDRALLTSPGRGRSGGALTDKARRILNGQH